MTATAEIEELAGLAAARHVCWVLDDGADYEDIARRVLTEGASLGQKSMVFGPAGAASLEALRDSSAVAADPYVAYFGRRPFEAGRMLSMFTEQTAIARAEGFEGLRVVADMDWLLPAAPTAEEIVGFELLLDRLVPEVDATVVCAYRRSSFQGESIAGALCVHSTHVGLLEEPQFSLVADGEGWRLSGEVDLSVITTFTAALAAATESRPSTIDVSELEFIDVPGLRAVAQAARAAEGRVELRGARRGLRRSWELGGFAQLCPMVEVTP